MKKVVWLLIFVCCFAGISHPVRSQEIRLPAYPSYEEVINHFFEQYELPEIEYDQDDRVQKAYENLLGGTG